LHKKADHILYELAGILLSAISKIAKIRDMHLRGLSPEIGDDQIDLFQQNVAPEEENVVSLKSNT
jgi:hypothetical protein